MHRGININIFLFCNDLIFCSSINSKINFFIQKSFEETGVAIKVICPGAVDTNLVSDNSHRYLKHLDQEKAVKVVADLPRQS